MLFLVSDDLRPELGVYGGKAITPNVDKLAKSPGAVVMERSYVQQAICCPTRSSFLTGRRPDTTKVWDLHTHFRASGGAFTTLPQYFLQNGWYSMGMGKVFHPVKDPATGLADDVGFSWSGPYFRAPAEPEACEGGHCLGGNMTMCWNENTQEDDGYYVDTANARHGVAIMRNASKSSQPFFIAVGIHRPHLPWDVPAHYYSLYPSAEETALADHNTMPKNYGAAQQWSWDPQSGPRHCGPLNALSDPEAPGGVKMGQYDLVPDDVARNFRRAYYAAVSSMDYNMGLVLDELTALQLDKKTIVVFLGDHAWQLGDIGEFGKKTNFERATRTPLIFRVPPALLGAEAAAAHAAARGPDGVVRSHALVEFVDM